MKQLVFDITPPPQPTLGNFVVGPNAEVLANLRALLAGESAERFVYLWGGGWLWEIALIPGRGECGRRASVARLPSECVRPVQ